MEASWTVPFLSPFPLSPHLFADVHSRKDRSNMRTGLAVQRIESGARSDGLPPHQIIQLVDLATSKLYGNYVLHHNYMSD